MEKWFLSPTKKTLIYFTIVWTIGILMILLASDFFKSWSLLLTMLVVISTSAIIGIYVRYLSNKAQ